MTSDNIDDINEKTINELEKENLSLLCQLNDVQTRYEEFSNIFKQLNINPDKIKEGQTELKYKDGVIPVRLFDEIIEISKSLINFKRETAETDQTKNIGLSSLRSPAAFLALPSRLLGTLTRKDANKLFAGECRKLVDAHNKGGENEVARLLAPYSSKVKADAYTSLCKRLIQKDKKQTASYALKAWRHDPAPFRMKYLAYRTFENDQEIRAFALLLLLPDDIPMSDSEIKKAKMIEKKAWKALQISSVDDPAKDKKFAKSKIQIKEVPRPDQSAKDQALDNTSEIIQRLVMEMGKDKKIYDAFMPLFLKGNKGS